MKPERNLEDNKEEECLGSELLKTFRSQKKNPIDLRIVSDASHLTLLLNTHSPSLVQGQIT